MEFHCHTKSSTKLLLAMNRTIVKNKTFSDLQSHEKHGNSDVNISPTHLHAICLWFLFSRNIEHIEVHEKITGKGVSAVPKTCVELNFCRKAKRSPAGFEICDKISPHGTENAENVKQDFCRTSWLQSTDRRSAYKDEPLSTCA